MGLSENEKFAVDVSLIESLPDDVFAIISRRLSPRDMCNLGACCRSLNAIATSEKVWLAQCDAVGFIPPKDLVEWRKGVSSYKALCRFIICVRPMIGVWVHQNPELGNVVYVMPGFVSVVGCRIIPQELGPLGIEDGPILWAPVFEIIGGTDGSAVFLLHGTEKGVDYVYPGRVKPVDRNCNVLLLEVEPRLQKDGGKLLHSTSFVQPPDWEVRRRFVRSSSGLSVSQTVIREDNARVPFGRLGFSDRRKLLESVTQQVRWKVPFSAWGPLFPGLRDDGSFQMGVSQLLERRSIILKTIHAGSPAFGSDKSLANASFSELVGENLTQSSNAQNSAREDDGVKERSLSMFFRKGIKRILGKSHSDIHVSLRSNGSSSKDKHAQLHEFLSFGDTIGLTIHASTVKLQSYRSWPTMHDSRFALYKLPLRRPKANQNFAGFWGGTFGWPPGKPTEDKPGKALFLLMLSYEESQDQHSLIATKILEGTNYVLHPNGSAMFIVNTDQQSMEPFPYSGDANSIPVIVERTFEGEGIAHGYGFRYPGSKPGLLFVFGNGMLAFVWKESRAVLTLQKLDLEDLLKKGERVPALPAICNFTYLTKSYSNVFTGFSNYPNSLPSPRQRRA
ncbi:hypothetical protein MLD38_031491 [Melastoma candidum]|uniref:Uncharacterized protein n=1 Tax=Melastoma candidum TaxID=119954 RepID=A0ACB9MPV6_9MYRT|nr:hypothetical protein MLD38_031491 [Melastoma candidum]